MYAITDNMDLINNFIKKRILKTAEIIKAFYKIKREDFVPENFKKEAYINAPLSIGFGQTISQPETVAFMLELLQPQKGDKILEIGFGSGWQTALLCEIIGKKGKVFGIERIPELKEFGEKNISKYNFIKSKRAVVMIGDGAKGFKKEAPFDKIIVAASADSVPPALKEQLKINGRLVIPIKNSIWLLIKKTDNQFEEIEYPGFVFVPLISEK